jgi:dCTP deaminase
MAFLGYDELKRVLEKNIIPFNEKLFQKTSYELSLGNEVYVTNSPTGKKEILTDINSTVNIDPGQFALLLIEEEVNIPFDKIALITLKFGVKIRGLVNISGFHVDPGFNGKLVYAVYNAGTRTIVMEKGKPYFSIWFSELKGQAPTGTDKAYNGKYQGQKNIRTEDIEALKGELWNPIELANRIKNVKNELNTEINNLESKKDFNRWVLGIGIGILITILLKIGIFDLTGYNYNKGYKDAMQLEKVKNEIIQKKIDLKIDSILNLRMNLYMKELDKKYPK